MRRLRHLLERSRFDRELEEEMCHHLALSAEEQGTAEAARRRFGNVTSIKERSRAMWTWTLCEQFVQDIRYGLRSMAANPLFTIVAVFLLALGIGANTAIYSFMDAIMLRALPVQHSEQLVILNWHTKAFPAVSHGFSGRADQDPTTGFTSGNFPFAAFELIQARHDVFSKVFAFAGMGRLIAETAIKGTQGHAEIADGELISGAFYGDLGVRPALGRLIDDQDDRARANVAVISYAWWQRRFTANPNVIGQSVVINNAPFTIIGVSAPGFFGVNPSGAPEIFMPIHAAALLSTTDTRFLDKNFYWVEIMGRLKPGIGIHEAQAMLGAQFHQFETGTASNNKERSDLPELLVEEGGSGIDSLRRQYSKPLFVLMTMVALILTVACANTANLLLARATARRREIAMRLSLGAGRARLIRQLLTESILLAAMGGLLGIGIAALGIRFITWLLANGRDHFTLHADISGQVLGFTLCLALLAGILFGFAPALQATKLDLTPALREARSGASRKGRPGLSHVLIVCQIAVSLLLVIGAGLFVRTLSALESVELGFNREHLLLFAVMPKQAGYNSERMVRLFEELRKRFAAIPGVRSASLSDGPLINEGISRTGLRIPGIVTSIGFENGTALMNVGPSFFTTMQIPILRGREIGERDTTGSQPVAVVNEIFAKKYFGGENPLGRRIGLGGNAGKFDDYEIVGVAKTARYNSLKGDVPPVVYLPYVQNLKVLNYMVFELRTATDPLSFTPSVRRIVRDVSPRVPVFNVTTQSAQIDQTIGQERTFAELCTCFGVLALAIASIGLYGTMAYAVSRRTSEIGVRMALGAERRRIIRMVFKEVFTLTAAGLAIGLAIAWATSRFVESFLFGVKRDDPLSILISLLVLITAVSAAGYAPAWKASRIDPMVALRHE
ncbi:MAG TPA: ABC transporter permease [Bryobacteraceae bacterium]